MAKYTAKPRMQEIRKAKGIETNKELAQKVGVTEPTISRFDKQQRYDIDVLISVSKVLGVSVEELFTIEENKESSN